MLAFNALVLVSRETDGKIDIEDDAHTKSASTAVGTAGGMLVGVIFPPAILAAGLVGAGIGAGVGKLRSHAVGGGHLREVAAPGRQGHQARGRPGRAPERLKAPASA